jgi:hypothetical protein
MEFKKGDRVLLVSNLGGDSIVTFESYNLIKPNLQKEKCWVSTESGTSCVSVDNLRQIAKIK